MLSTLRKLIDLLNPREKRQALILFMLMLVLGVVEMAGVASIFPLIAVLSDPSLIQSNHYLRMTYETLGFRDNNSFFVFLTASVFAVLVLRTCLSAITNYGTLRYALMRSHTLSARLLGSYLRRPYAWFLDHHSADMGKSVLSEVEQVVNGSLMPVLQLASSGVVAIFLVAMVIAVDPFVTTIVLLLTTLIYGAVYVSIRRYLLHKGQDRMNANQQRFKMAQEVLAGVKEVKIGGLEATYLKRFDQASFKFGRLRSQLQLLRTVPRNMLELISIGGILVVILVLLLRADGDLSAVLPVIALYAFAGLRLLPAMQTVYQSIVGLRFGQPALDALYTDLFDAEHVIDLKPVTAMPLVDKIELENVRFAYPKSQRIVLKDVSLTIPARTAVGLVGPSGAGKSTVIDIILGLLEPQNGHLKVDGMPITGANVRSWQRSVGYVPQQIFLADETIAANIALGLPNSEIDLALVERAARMANLHDFIVEDLPDGYATEVGDRGVRLSGGQRQRVGIARALYNNPQVLVFDEATSALDALTERAIIDAVASLRNNITIIMIAHRIQTVRDCDQILVLNSGEIQSSGKYDDLVRTSESFKALINVT